MWSLVLFWTAESARLSEFWVLVSSFVRAMAAVAEILASVTDPSVGVRVSLRRASVVVTAPRFAMA